MTASTGVFSTRYSSSMMTMMTSSREAWSMLSSPRRKRRFRRWRTPCARFARFCPLLLRPPLTLFREAKDLEQLSSLGHFLKGSSAALGVTHVRASCEEIQNYGKQQEGTKVITAAEAIVKITK